jgi:uncharacterized protein YcbK (DUF882 family)
VAAPAALERLWAASLAAGLGALASLPAATTLALDPAPQPTQVSPSGLVSVKKEPGPSAFVEAPSAPMLTLATLVNTHTGEVVVLDDEQPDGERWSSLLEDRVTGARTTMSPRLLDMLRALARKNAGAKIELVSGFRSPKLNEVLRKKGHRVASHSQHSLGHAVDFRIGDLSPAAMRAAVEALGWKGGIGQYDKPTDHFIHVDIGRDRRWRER